MAGARGPAAASPSPPAAPDARVGFLVLAVRSPVDGALRRLEPLFPLLGLGLRLAGLALVARCSRLAGLRAVGVDPGPELLDPRRGLRVGAAPVPVFRGLQLVLH